MELNFITGYNNVGKTFYLFNKLVARLQEGKKCILVNTTPRSYEGYEYTESLILARLWYAYKTFTGSEVDLFALEESVAANFALSWSKLDLSLDLESNFLICNNIELLDLYGWEDAEIFFTDECADPALAQIDIQYAINYVKRVGAGALWVDYNNLVSTDFVGAGQAKDWFISESDKRGFVCIEDVQTHERSIFQLHTVSVYGQ